MSTERERLPDGLAQLLPGPELAAALADVDVSKLNGHDLITLMPMLVKMVSHYQAGMAAALEQVLHRRPGGADSPAERSEDTNRWAEIDVAARLHWSAGKAEYQLRYAQQIVDRLPLVHAALGAGLIDFDRARTIVDGVALLDDQAAQLVAAKVLSQGAGGWSVRKLAERLRRESVAYDAAAAARRRRERQRQRRVETGAHPDGTVDIYGLNLPPQRVAEIMERVRAIARAAKQHGDQRTIGQLMADTLTDLLAGTGIGASPPGPVSNPGPTGHPHQADDEPVNHLADEDPVADDPAGPPAAEGTAASAQPEMLPLPGPRRGVVHLHAFLSTLAGLDHHPGELAGTGPVAADIVSQVIAAHPEARWQFSIYNDVTGRLFHHGTTHTRPTLPSGSGFSAADAAFIRARDKTCRGPHGCNVSAVDCELDHTVARADGGGHEPGNGGPVCTRDHHYKHDSGARLEQPEPGTFIWTTQFGHTYVIEPEPHHEPTHTPLTHPGRARQRLTALLPTDTGPAP